MQSGTSSLLLLAGGIIIAIAIVGFSGDLKTEMGKTGTFVVNTIDKALTSDSTAIQDSDSPVSLVYDFNTKTASVSGLSGNQTDVAVPSSVTHNGDEYKVTEIRDSAFYKSNITSISIPTTVTKIGEQAFAQSQLKTITIPSSVTSIGSYAFYSSKLTSVNIPDSVTYLGDNAFVSSKNLTSATIGKGVSVIRSGTFEYTGLKSIILPDTLTQIDNYAFNTTYIEDIYIPNSVKTIGSAVFTNADYKNIKVSVKSTTSYQANSFGYGTPVITVR